MTEPTNLKSYPPVWVIMPVLANREYTMAAIADVMNQTVPVKLLIVNQGVDAEFREDLERVAEHGEDRIFLWSHQPPLPSLAATWNRALDFVWVTAGSVAMVVNNDIRLHRGTIGHLLTAGRNYRALFVSCVGWSERQWMDTMFKDREASVEHEAADGFQNHGGPDFSCFMISHECHDRYRFDEAFTPAFCEDLDYHRRLLLAGEGSRIFSINLPYLHYGSTTIKSVDPKQRSAIEQAIQAGSRTYYARKWGGPVNAETYLSPFNGNHFMPVTDGTATTPYLQAHPPTMGAEADRG